MPRTNIVAQTTVGAYPTLPVTATSQDITMVAADIVNFNETTLVENKTVVLAHNEDVGAVTITFTSAADSLGRTGDITAYSIGAGKISLFGPFKAAGWTHAGKLQFAGSDVDLKLAVITLP